MFTRRDVCIAVAAAAVTAGGFALADEAPVLGSWAKDWNSVPVVTSASGASRSFFRGRTATLENLDVHVTTVNPGDAPHPPNKHPNEELLIVKEGTITVLINGESKTLGPGSVAFLASNVMHAVRNEGNVPAVYHVIGFRTAETPAK